MTNIERLIREYHDHSQILQAEARRLGWQDQEIRGFMLGDQAADRLGEEIRRRQ